MMMVTVIIMMMMVMTITVMVVMIIVILFATAMMVIRLMTGCVPHFSRMQVPAILEFYHDDDDGDNHDDDGNDYHCNNGDIYIMMKCVSICHERSDTAMIRVIL